MLLLLLAFFGCVFLYACLRTKSKSHPPLPPGPPADPIIGHLRLIPPDNQEKLFYEWGKIYGQSLFLERMSISVLTDSLGDVMHIHFLGQSVVVLNSAKAAVDLLDKRSANYSDRPHFALLEMFDRSPP